MNRFGAHGKPRTPFILAACGAAVVLIAGTVMAVVATTRLRRDAAAAPVVAAPRTVPAVTMRTAAPVRGGVAEQMAEHQREVIAAAEGTAGHMGGVAEWQRAQVAASGGGAGTRWTLQHLTAYVAATDEKRDAVQRIIDDEQRLGSVVVLTSAEAPADELAAQQAARYELPLDAVAVVDLRTP